MAERVISQLQYDTAKQNIRELYCRIDLLNFDMEVVDELSSVALQWSFSTSTTSNLRRTATLSVTPYGQETLFKIQQGSKIWLDKYVRIYMGIKSTRTQEIAWSNMGTFLINNPSRAYSATQNTLTLELIDLMTKLTGARNGYLDGYAHQILAGANLREAIIAVLAKGGFTQYDIKFEDGDYTTAQYDIKIDGNRSLYDLLTAINEQNINYQMYFDVDGVFHYCKVPTGANEPVMVTDDLWKYVYIGHNESTPYDQLKNHIIVLGKTHEVNNYCNALTVSGTTLNGTCSSVTKMRNHIKLGFTTPNNMSDITTQSYLNLNGYGAYPIRTAGGNIPKLKANTYYVLKSQNYNNSKKNNCIISGSANATTYNYSFISDTANIVGAYIYAYNDKDGAVMFASKITALDTTNHTITVDKTLDANHGISNVTYYIFYIYDVDSQAYWQFMGELQPRAEVQDNNPDSPFYVGGTIGDIKVVLSGGDYDNISTSDLALERAKWELYTKCKFYDNITLNCVPIYWLDVNWLVEITLPNKDTAQYIIKNIETSGGTTGVQNITLTRYYPYYDENSDAS